MIGPKGWSDSALRYQSDEDLKTEENKRITEIHRRHSTNMEAQ